MIITSLLDKTVIYGDTKAKICAIYEKNFTVWLGLVTYDGQLIFGILPAEVRIDKYGQYKVYLYHTYEKKIFAIKLYREFTGVGLKEAKDKVEASPAKVLIADNLTYEEAEEMLRKIRLQKMDGEIDG